MAQANLAPTTISALEANPDLPTELREAVADYRNPSTEQSEREYARSFWESHGAANQFSALLLAGALETYQASH